VGRVSRVVTGQLARPHGRVGWMVGRGFARNNADVNRFVVQQLEVAPHERVADLGCGPGLGIQALGEAAHEGKVLGVDHSKAMIEQARRRNAEAVERGQVILHRGDLAELPAASLFDAVMTVHTIYFWSDPLRKLINIRQGLVPGGRVAICLQEHGPVLRRMVEDGGYLSYRRHEVVALLARTGFAHIEVREVPHSRLDEFVVLARAAKPR
jgi:SAM-dependent methyltransferase